MKKLLSMVLAFAMAMSLSVTAFAEESADVIGSADGPTSILISPNPNAAPEMPDLENMTEAELDAYFSELQAQYEAEAAAQAAQQKAQMIALAKAQMPYPDGINVWLNGAYMTFEDAAPAIVGGRTQVPFRAILEGLGAEVTYDQGKIEAIFDDGSVMKLAIGSNVITYTWDNGDKFTSAHMDVVPFIDAATGRTYVPARYIGEILNLTVTWDPDVRVAYIVDWDALQTELDTQFSEFNEMMALSMANQLDTEKTWQSKDQIVLRGTLDGQSRDALEFSLKGTGLMKGQEMSGKYKLGVDLGGYASTLNLSDPDAAEALKALNGQEVELIFNLDNGIYLRSELISVLTGGAVQADGWLKVADLMELYIEAGMDPAMLTNQFMSDFTMGKLIRLMCEDGTLGAAMGYMPPDNSARMFAVFYSGCFGNDAITVSGSYSKTYTCKFGIEDIFEGMAKGGLLAQEDLDMLMPELDGMTMDFEMVLTARSGKVTRTTAEMLIEMEGIKMTMDIYGTTSMSEGSMVIDVDEVGKLELEFNTDLSTTTKEVQTQPAQGEQVVTLEELVDLMVGTMIP